eukprot:1463455-Heterocapsa_arctica.AAC.1
MGSMSSPAWCLACSWSVGWVFQGLAPVVLLWSIADCRGGVCGPVSGWMISVPVIVSPAWTGLHNLVVPHRLHCLPVVAL